MIHAEFQLHVTFTSYHQCLLLLLLLLLVPVLVSADLKIHVAVNGTANDTTCWKGSDSKPCGNLYLALQGMHEIQPPVAVALVIHTGNYQLNSSDYNHFASKRNFSFIKSKLDSVVNINCTKGAGLSFANVANVTFRGVSFINCGAMHNSTFNLTNTSGHQFVLMYAALYFMNCTDVMLDSITISRSLGIAVQFYATVGTNIITKSKFTENPFPSNTPQGGGVYIEFPNCYPGLIETCGQVVPASVSNSYFVIQDSQFIENNASVFNVNTSSRSGDRPKTTTSYAFGDGGGVSIIFNSRNASYNRINITQNSKCWRNSAYNGGCMYIDFRDESNNNTVTIQDFEMANNSAIQNGGGIDLRYNTSDNTIRFHNCTFQNNSARYGGGLSLFSERKFNEMQPFNTVLVNRCKFYDNTGTVGAAASLKSGSKGGPMDEIQIAPIFEESCFENNVNEGTYESGIIHLNYIPAIFNGTITFLRNNGSAILAIGNTVVVDKNARMNFTENQAIQGAAFYLLRSLVVIKVNTVLNFVRNHATKRGGAIYAEFSMKKDSSPKQCFLIYKDENNHSSWNVNVHFENNTMGNKKTGGSLACPSNTTTNSRYMYNAIFATSILPCLSDSLASSTPSLEEKLLVFHWNNCSWQYTCPCPEIRTEPYKLVQHEEVHVTPGVQMNLRKLHNISAYDDLEMNVTESLVVDVHSKNEQVSLGENNRLSSFSAIRLYVFNHTITTAHLSFHTIPRAIIKDITVNIDKCPVGFILIDGICKFSFENTKYLKQSKHDLSTKILRRYWVGLFDNTTELVVGYCEFCKKFFSIYNNSRYVDISFTSNDDLICAAANRTGPFCTSCKPNHSMAVFSEDLVCIENQQDNSSLCWVFFVILNVVFIFGVGFSLLIFDISCTAGPLGGALFFVQMVTTAVIVDGDGVIEYFQNSRTDVHPILTCVYGFFNLDFCHFAFANCLTVSSNTSLPEFYMHFEVKTVVMLLFTIAVGFSIKCWKHKQYIKMCGKKFRENNDQINDGEVNSEDNQIPEVNSGEDHNAQRDEECTTKFNNIDKHYINMAASFVLLRYTSVAITSFTVLSQIPIYKNNTQNSIKNVLKLNSIQTYDEFCNQNEVSISFLYLSLLLVLLLLFLILCCRFKKNNNQGRSNTGRCIRLCSHTVSVLNSFASFIEPFQSPFKDGQGEDETRQNYTCIPGCNEDTDIESKEPLQKIYNKVIAKVSFCLDFIVKAVQNRCGNCRINSWNCSLTLNIPLRGNYKFVGGLYLLLRLAFLSIYAYYPDFMSKCISQILLSMFASIFVLVFRPYRVNMYNNIDGFFFFALGVLISLCSYQFYLTETDHSISIPTLCMQIILLALPIFWIFFYILLIVIISCRKMYKHQ